MEKIDGYGLDIKEIEKIIKQGMKWKEENTNKWHSSMTGIECVFSKEMETIFVITVYAEARKK